MNLTVIKVIKAITNYMDKHEGEDLTLEISTSNQLRFKDMIVRAGVMCKECELIQFEGAKIETVESDLILLKNKDGIIIEKFE